MYLPPESIKEFRRIWREEYGEDISFERAQLESERFLSGVRLMLTRKGPSDVDEGHSD